MAPSVPSQGLYFWNFSPSPGCVPDVDIVAVQGLGADPYYTWVRRLPRSKHIREDGESKSTRTSRWRDRMTRRVARSSASPADDQIEVHWLRDLLTAEFPNARIATYSYPSDWRDRSIKTSLRQCGEQLLNTLFQHRQDAGETRRPLILIGHSLGGLVIQQALVTGVHNVDFSDLRQSIAGIIFLGTVFHGSDAASYVKAAAKMFGSDTTLIGSLESGSEDLRALSSDFSNSYFNHDVVCFYERHALEQGPFKTTIATPSSATLPGRRAMFLDTDHSGLNKFHSSEDDSFILVLSEIRRMIKNGPVKSNGSAKSVEQLKPPPKAKYFIRFNPNDTFVGREEQFGRLRNMLIGKKNCPRAALCGLGGMGKTQIALRFAYQVQEEDLDCSIFWISCVSSDTLQHSYQEIARQLKLDISADKATDTVKYVHEHLKSAEAGRWLLVFDNVDEREILFKSNIAAGSITEPPFPYSANGAILFTTRYRDTATSLARTNIVDVVEMDASIAKTLFSNLMSERTTAELDASAVSELLQALTYLPLAITQAAAYITSTVGVSVSDYLELLQSTEDTQLQTLSRNFEDENRYPESQNPVAATWLVSFRHIENVCPLASDIISLLSCIQPVAIPDVLLRDNDQKEKSTYAIGKLCAYRFITKRDNSPIYDMHRLVHLAARNWVKKGDRTVLAQISTVHRLTEVYPWHDDEGRYLGRILFPHGTSLLREYRGPKDESWRVLVLKTSSSMCNEGRVEENVQHLRSAQNGFEVSLSRDSPMRLDFCRHLANTLVSIAQFKEAIELIESHLDTSKTPVQYSGIQLALRLHLAEAYLGENQIEHATRLIEDTIKMKRESPPIEQAEETHLELTLARVYLENDQVQKAIKILEAIVHIRCNTLAEDHDSRLASEHELARAYLKNSQIQEAIELLEKIVRLRQDTLTKDHPSRLASEHELARAYLKNSQIQEAIELFEEVVRLKQDTLTEDHPSRLASEHELARAYLENSQIQEAIELLERIVLSQDTLIENHPRRLASEYELALVYLGNSQIQKGTKLIERIVRIERDTLAEDNPRRLASEHVLAKAYYKNGRLKEALDLLTHTVSVRQASQPADHPGRVLSEESLQLVMEEYARRGLGTLKP